MADDPNPQQPQQPAQGDAAGRPVDAIYRRMIDSLPLDTVEYAFAYGSGAVAQRGENMLSKMVDFILVSRDSLSFHRENLARNPAHYSTIPRTLGAEKVELLQSNFAARIYYNTRIPSHGTIIKYGVISLEDLKSDLLDWCWLYAAGRLHKPVLDVVAPRDQDLLRALTENRRSALQAALLQLPDSFTFEELFMKIASISYTGDFRVYVAEDVNKVQKLVQGAYNQFMRVYLPMLTADQRLQIDGNNIRQDSSTRAIYHRLNLLPSEVLHGLALYYRQRDLRMRDLEEVTFAMAHRHDVAEQVQSAIARIVRGSATTQTLKNGFTAGILNSVIYSAHKVMKMLQSLR